MCLISYDDEPDPDEPDPDEPDPGEPADRTRGTAQAPSPVQVPSTVQARSAALVRSAAQEHARSAAPDRAHGTAPDRAGRSLADAPARDARPRPGLLFVPVRATDAGPVLRMFRTPLGERTAVGFTARDLLTATLGAGHAAIRLAEPALRLLVEPLGVDRVVVDPALSAPAVSRAPAGGDLLPTRVVR
ncbi:SAV_915 family protein [Streptomyces sp. NRRL F-5681]|uniref:SAV_915 family protein n=1 Tax=Streptomyces sp. NRRL F-5681 TaxID=1463869 RepID=UPI000ADBBDE7